MFNFTEAVTQTHYIVLTLPSYLGAINIFYFFTCLILLHFLLSSRPTNMNTIAERNVRNVLKKLYTLG